MAAEQQSAQVTQYFLQLSMGDALSIIGLITSLVGNVIQFQRHKALKHSVYNGLVGIFNQVGWVIAFCMGKEQAATNKKASASGDSKVAYEEMGQIVSSVSSHCRMLHEGVASMAKTLDQKDKRWQGQFFGMKQEDIDKLLTSLQRGADHI